MNTRIIATEQELIAIKDDWDKLVQSNPETDMPFYSWEWFYRSYLHFGKPRGQDLFVVAVYEEKQMIGILPLVRGIRKSAGMVYRLLYFCNVGMMPRNTMYTDSIQNQESIYRAAWEHLFIHRTAWDMIEFANVPDTSPFHRFVLTGEHCTGYALIQNKGFIAPHIELTGTLDDYLKSLSKGTRKDINKHVRHFVESETPHSIRFFEKPEEMNEGLNYLHTVHANSWKGDYVNQHYPQFYQEITSILAEYGEVKIAVIFLNAIPIGGAYMLCKNGVYYGCIRDYDQKYKEYTPGILLLHYQLEHLLQEGGRIFDFCGTTYDHKEKFGTGHHRHSTFQIFHSGTRSRFIYRAKTILLPLYRRMFRKPEPGDFIMCRSEW